jgi:hypothetical protein
VRCERHEEKPGEGRQESTRGEGGPPAGGHEHDPGEPGRKSRADRIDGGVEGLEAGLAGPAGAIGQGLQARHVGAGDADPGEPAPDERRAEPVEEQGRAEPGRDRDEEPRRHHPPRVDPVGQAHEEGGGRGVGEIVDGRDPADLGLGQAELGRELRHEGLEGHVAGEPEDERRAEEEGRARALACP